MEGRKVEAGLGGLSGPGESTHCSSKIGAECSQAQEGSRVTMAACSYCLGSPPCLPRCHTDLYNLCSTITIEEITLVPIQWDRVRQPPALSLAYIKPLCSCAEPDVCSIKLENNNENVKCGKKGHFCLLGQLWPSGHHGSPRASNSSPQRENRERPCGCSGLLTTK